ncbi:hypothetical protein STEG23_000806, partial [Scotinomys teguina]
MNVTQAGLSSMSLKHLFDNATALAENITDLATDMRLEFFHDKFSSKIFNKIISNLNKEKKMAELVNSCHTLPIKIPETKEAVRNTTVNPAIHEDKDLPVWSDRESLRSDDEEIRFFALYLFSYCLRLDLRIVEFYVNILKCIVIDGSLEQKCSQTNVTKAGMFLLILVLNLLLCENVAPLPMNVSGAGHRQVYLQDLFDHALMLTYNISELNMEMSNMFLLDLNKDEKTMSKMLDSCHTLPINSPQTIQEARKLALEDFLKIVLNLMGTWNDPLHYQVAKLTGMPGANDAILSTAKGIEAQNKELLKLISWILNTMTLCWPFSMKFHKETDLEQINATIHPILMFILNQFHTTVRHEDKMKGELLLLVVVSNFLLWENVASVPSSSIETDDDQLYLKELFDHAMILIQNISKLNTELRRTYMLEFFEDQEFLIKTLTCCHNYSIKTPENLDEAQRISVEDFPKLILSRVWAWNDTLKNLLTILRNRTGTHNDVILLAKDIERKNAELSEDIKNILSSIYIKTENVDYTVLTGLEDLQSSDEEFRHFALCKLSYCLRVDMNMVDICLKLLICVIV